MRGIKIFTNLIIFISSGILVASYFFPVEGSWAPVDAWQGYLAGGGFLKGFDVACIEIAPFAVGLIVLIVLTLLRWTKTALVLLMTFTGLWIFVGVWYISRLFALPMMNFPLVWPIMLISIVIPGVISLVVVARKTKLERFVWVYLAILAMISLFQQSISIAFYIVEDKLLLNIGSVTGVAAAVGLIVSLFVRGQIQEMSGNQVDIAA